jgi:alpha-L-fucosidase
METYWTTDGLVISGSIELDFEPIKQVEYMLVHEFVKLGQRVKSFNNEVCKNGEWEQVVDATTIGYERIIRVEPADVEKLGTNIAGSKACPIISNLEVY